MRYLDSHADLLRKFEKSMAADSRFAQVCADFESQKVRHKSALEVQMHV